MFLFRQTRAGNIFDVFVISDTMPRKVLRQGVKNRKITGCQIQRVWGMVHLSPAEILQQVSILLCHMQLGIFIEGSHVIGKKKTETITASKKKKFVLL
jgi:hypothetical protein